MIIDDIAKEFSKLDYVDAVVLSGSQTGLIQDEKSDYDMYVYASRTIPLDFREELAKKYTDNYEVGNTFFEDGDEWNLKNPNMGVDLMYRNLDWVKSEIDWTWKKHNAKVAYTTCFLHNVKTSKVLFDRNGEFQKFIDELNQPYPEKLKEHIIAKNYPLLGCSRVTALQPLPSQSPTASAHNPLLKQKSASFYEQLELAILREDYVSQNHRVTAILTSYFDILFAINGQTHPGEKKLVAYAEKLCPILPKDFKQDVENVVKSVGTKNVLPALDKMLVELDKIIQ